LGQLATLLGTVGRVLDMGATTLELVVGLLDTDDGEAVAREHLGDAGAHRAEADDADRGELSGHGPDPPTCEGMLLHEVRHPPLRPAHPPHRTAQITAAVVRTRP